MSVTVKDVARLAGVSTATVSRALRGFGTVDPAITQRVVAAADRLGYVGSHAAAALSTGKAGTIAIITPFVDRLAFQRMLTGVERELRDTGIDLLIHWTGDPSDPHPVPPHKRLAKRVDGFIVMSLSPESPDLAEILNLRMPLTMFGAHAAGASSVQIDDREAAATAVGHLLDLGHRRIGIVYGREHENPLVLEHQRHLGVRDALTRAGIDPDPGLWVPGEFTMGGGAAAMEELLGREEPPTAVFAFSDEMAYGAIQTVRRRGLALGDEVALIGFDGHEMSSILDLSTISVPFEELGSRAAGILLSDIGAGGSAGVVSSVLPTELVVRSSTAAGGSAVEASARD